MSKNLDAFWQAFWDNVLTLAPGASAGVSQVRYQVAIGLGTGLMPDIQLLRFLKWRFN